MSTVDDKHTVLELTVKYATTHCLNSRNSGVAHAYQHMRVVMPWHKNQLVITFKSSISSLLQVKTISTTIEVQLD